MPTPPFKLPALYAITNTDSHHDPRAYIYSLLHAGIELLQIRDKTSSDESLIQLVQVAMDIARDCHRLVGRHPLIIVNDRIDVLLQSEADGLHLGQDDMDPAEARAVLGSEKLIGLSTHTLEQLQLAQTAPIDYVAFGPVFETRSKKNPWPTVGLDRLAQAVSRSQLPLVAIGGINRDNVTVVYKAGVRSVAVIRNLQQADDLQSAVLSFNEKLCVTKPAQAS